MTTALVALLAIARTAEPWSVQRVLEAQQSGGLSRASEAELVAWFGGDKAVAAGAEAKVEGLSVAFAVRVPEGKHNATVEALTGDFRLALTQIGSGRLFVGAATLAEGAGFRWIFRSLSSFIGGTHDLEVYTMPAESRPDPAVPSGKLEQQPRLTSQVFGGTWHDWWVYTPAGFDPSKESDLVVFQDGQWSHTYAPVYFDHLVAKHELPQTVAVFVTPGTFPDGKSDRSREYDALGDAYVRFLLEEVLPPIEAKYKIAQDPRKRCVAGISSGGICSFTCAWERPDKFGLVMSWVGSFTNLQGGPGGFSGGNTYPAIIRARRGWDKKGEPKPIRAYLQDGANDLDNAAGNWPLANKEMASALEYGGYDFKFVFGQGFHSDKHGRAEMANALRWLFGR